MRFGHSRDIHPFPPLIVGDTQRVARRPDTDTVRKYCFWPVPSYGLREAMHRTSSRNRRKSLGSIAAEPHGSQATAKTAARAPRQWGSWSPVGWCRLPASTGKAHRRAVIASEISSPPCRACRHAISLSVRGNRKRVGLSYILVPFGTIYYRRALLLCLCAV